MVGERRYVKEVAALDPATGQVKARAPLDAQGAFTISGLSAGSYSIEPLAGGKFSLRVEPAATTAVCPAGAKGLRFVVRGIIEG